MVQAGPGPHPLALETPLNPTYGSVCSGIEAASVAWEPLGWKPLWFAEIEPFPSAVLAHHWPHVPNLGDFTRIKDGIATGAIEAPDVLVGGTPCQAFSFAGLRESMDDARGQLTLEFVRLADAIDEARSVRGRDPGIAVWENVPGVLSTHDNAFGCFLGALAGEDGPLEPPGGKWTNAGHVRGPRRTIVWRVLDAEYFGVAQRRRRVFVVASARTDCGPEILFEFDGVRRDSPPSRETGEGVAADVAPCLGASGRGFERAGETRGQDPVIAVPDVAGTLRSGSTSPNAHGKLNGTDRMDLVVHAVAFEPGIMGRTAAGHTFPELSGTLRSDAGDNQMAVAFDCKASGSYGFQESEDTAGTLRGAGHGGGHSAVGIPVVSGTLDKGVPGRGAGNAVGYVDHLVATTLMSHSGIHDNLGQEFVVQCPQAQLYQVRRLTPTECARLQGFPDHHAQIPWRKRPDEECPDGPQYKAYGNSMCTKVMFWLGKRIVDTMFTPR